MNQIALITGSSGFVGSNMTKFLHEKNFFVIGLDVRTPKFYQPDKFILADVRNLTTVSEILNKFKPHVIFHLAAISTIQVGQSAPEETWSVNFNGTQTLMNAVNLAGLNKTKIFFASTDKVYGMLPKNISTYREDLPLNPLRDSPYDCSKAAADDFIRNFNNTTVLRFCNIFGPCDTNVSRVVPATISALLNDKVPILNRYVDVNKIEHDFYRDMLFIDDLCESLLKLAVNADNFEEKILNFGVNSPTAMDELIHTIIKLMNVFKTPKIKFISTANEITRQNVDFSRAQKLLKFYPKTSLENGLSKTIEWWKNFKINVGEKNE